MIPLSPTIPVGTNAYIRTLTREAWSAIGASVKKADPTYRYVTGNWDLYAFRGATPLALEIDGELVSFVATYFSKRPKPGGWGAYTNNYLAYTPPQHRGHGHIITLNRLVEKAALQNGWERSTSLAAGWPGFLYQLKSRRTFWGLTASGELRCDTPLNPRKPQPSGVPPCAQDVVKDPHPLTAQELVEIIHNSTKYGQQPRKIVEEVLERHPLAYTEAQYRPRRTLLTPQL